MAFAGSHPDPGGGDFFGHISDDDQHMAKKEGQGRPMRTVVLMMSLEAVAILENEEVIL